MKSEIIESKGDWKTLNTLTPNDLGQAMQIAEILAKTSFSHGFKSAEDIFVAIMVGKDLGFSPMQSLQSLAIINGKATLYGDALLALCQAHPDYEGMIEEINKETKTAVCTVKRRGKPDVTEEFSIEDAKNAGLLGKVGPWKSYPKRMVRMRARSWALRAQFADALRGISSAEEMTDVPHVVHGGTLEHTPKAPDPIFQAVAVVEPEPIKPAPEPVKVKEKGGQDGGDVATTAKKAVKPPADSDPHSPTPEPTPQQKKILNRLEKIVGKSTLTEEDTIDAIQHFREKHGPVREWASQTLKDFENVVVV
jgi:hypothetical protein